MKRLVISCFAVVGLALAASAATKLTVAAGQTATIGVDIAIGEPLGTHVVEMVAGLQIEPVAP